MGFIEETGAAQHLRDARITPIYEGTNGIQALDLAGRKVGKDGGNTMFALIAEMRHSIDGMSAKHGRLIAAVDALEDATRWICETYGSNPVSASACAVLYLRLTGIAVGGWLTVKALEEAVKAGQENPAFLARKTASVRYFARFVLVEAPILSAAIKDGSAAIADCSPEEL
jgi:hypothetical protein